MYSANTNCSTDSLKTQKWPVCENIVLMCCLSGAPRPDDRHFTMLPRHKRLRLSWCLRRWTVVIWRQRPGLRLPRTDEICIGQRMSSATLSERCVWVCDGSIYSASFTSLLLLHSHARREWGRVHDVDCLCVHRVFLPQTGRLESRLSKTTSIVPFERLQSACHNANEKPNNYPVSRHSTRRETQSVQNQSSPSSPTEQIPRKDSFIVA